jgi:hypothetical protein
MSLAVAQNKKVRTGFAVFAIIRQSFNSWKNL